MSREWRDVLLGLLRERDPELDTHVHEVAALARGLGERLGLAAEDLADLVAAAEIKANRTQAERSNRASAPRPPLTPAGGTPRPAR